MNPNIEEWIRFASDNLKSSRVLVENELYDPAINNIQQCVEKCLKALLLASGEKIPKTHSIIHLLNLLEKQGVTIEMAEDDALFLDTIYLPTKYPVGGPAFPFRHGEATDCSNLIPVAESVLDQTLNILKKYE